MANKFKFSIISAVYNCEKFLDDMILSIINQDIGFSENIQLILVNDGSKDDSLSVCYKYRELYPDNIVVVDKENGGVSSARNAGFKYIRGEYINFIDSDDKFSLNVCSEVLKAFEEYGNSTDVVNFPFEYFGAKEGGEDHPQNEKFKVSSRLVDLEEEPEIMTMNVTFSFMRASAIENIVFDESLYIAEDLKFVNTILLKKRTVALINSCKLYYRKHFNKEHISLIDKKENLKQYYMPVIKNLAMWAYEFSLERYGYYPKFLQYVIASVLQEKIRQRYNYMNVLSPDEIKEHNKLLLYAMKTISNDVIYNYPNLIKEYKHFWLSQNNTLPILEISKNSFNYIFPEELVIQWHGFVDIMFLDVENGYLNIEAEVTLLPFENEENIDIYAGCQATIYKAEEMFSYEIKSILDIPVYYKKHFKVSIPLNKSLNGNYITFHCGIGDKVSRIAYIGYQDFCSVISNPIYNYYIKDNFYITAFNNRLEVKYVTSKEAKKIYKIRLALLKKNSKKQYYTRKLADFLMKFKRKEIWLISDRETAARDNGEALFKYLSENKPKKVKPYFVLNEDSADFTRLKKYGKVVACGSNKHKLLYLMSDKNISSHFDRYELRPTDPLAYRSYDVRKTNVFLQHGVTKDDISSIYSRFKNNISMFVCAGITEYQSMLDNKLYGFTEENAKLVGFPRFDLLENNTQKIITFLPTWRKSIFEKYDVENSKWILKKNYKESDFYKNYSAILNNTALIDFAEQHGYKFKLCAHLNTIEVFKNMTIDERTEVLCNNIDYKQVFSTSSILVTDYSSVAFDFAYLNKPIIYYHFDSESFFSQHTYKKGYFDYEVNGFGKIVFNASELSNALKENIENNCKQDPYYAERADEFFKYRDNNNCLRTVEAIMEMNNKAEETKQIIPVVFAANQYYVPYLATAIKSLTENIFKNQYYDIYIFNTDFNSETTKILNKDDLHFKITCVDVSKDIKKIEQTLYSMSKYISKETYYRILIPDILSKYDKVVYLDSDLCVLDNISEFYNIDIDEYLLGGIRNPLHNKMRAYIENELGLVPEKYINAGVLLMNTKRLREYGFADKCFEILKTRKNLRYMDQDAINLACAEQIKYIDYSWNFEWHFEEMLSYKDKDLHLKGRELKEYRKAKKKINIIHYTGDVKPWHNGTWELANYFWQYAYHTPFYNTIITRHSNDNCRKMCISYKNEIDAIRSSFSYKLGRFITFVPRKIIGFFKCLCEHGVKYTLKRIFQYLKIMR